VSLTLDLFAEPEPTVAQMQAASEVLREATERSRALREDLVFPSEPVAKGADSFALARLEDLNHHAYAFVAQARTYGSTDPSLIPVQVSSAGRREFDMDELARFANELLRGVRSIKPTMTPERWGEAIQRVREIGGKS
jgi:hypothetical protein